MLKMEITSLVNLHLVCTKGFIRWQWFVSSVAHVSYIKKTVLLFLYLVPAHATAGYNVQLRPLVSLLE